MLSYRDISGTVNNMLLGEAKLYSSAVRQPRITQLKHHDLYSVDKSEHPFLPPSSARSRPQDDGISHSCWLVLPCFYS